MSKIPLTMAVGPYEHVRDLATGRVEIEGVDLNFLDLPTLEIFHRFTHHREFDVAEMSFGRYISQFSQGDRSIIALPVFPSRMFRHAAIFVRADNSVTRPEDLAGKRIGVPEWAQTATIYIRGWLQHHVGIDLRGIQWIAAGPRGPNSSGEQVPVRLPEGFRLTRITDRGLGDLLVSGAIDAVFSASPLPQFRNGGDRVTRLFPNFQEVEHEYYRSTGIFPIMHIICMRRELADHHPWLAVNLLKAFGESKNNSLERLKFVGMSRYPLPWSNSYVAKTTAIFGDDFWPYGLEANRRTLEAFATYAYEQGVAHRQIKIEELFVENALELSTFYGPM